MEVPAMEHNHTYVGTAEAANLLHISSRRVIGLCNEGKIVGAFQDGRY